MQNIGRNDPCPCGSGKKYKHCCGRMDPRAQVLYIHPAKQGVDFFSKHFGSQKVSLGRPYGLIPLGVPALVNGLLARDIPVKGLNFPMERQLDARFDLRAWLGGHQGARLILIDMHWYEHTYGAISVAEVCKNVLPDAWTVLGGLTASGFAKEILEHFPAVDFVIRGDAELPLWQLAQGLLAKDSEAFALSTVPNLSYRRPEGDVVENPLTYCAASGDLDDLDFVDISFLEHHEAYLVHEYIVTDLNVARQAMEDDVPFQGRWIATARGCKFECSYCGGCKSAHRRLAGRDGIIPRSPEKVVAELARLADMDVAQASLSYDIAEMGTAYWRKLLTLLRKRDVGIGVYNECFQLPPRGFAKTFARAVNMEHSCLALSPLSGSEHVRRLNGKQYTDDELFFALDALNLYNIPVLIYFSLNLPGENETTIQETVQLAERIYAHYPSALLKILNTCHTLDPLSPMQQHPEKYGIQVTFSTFMDFYTYCRETQVATSEARTGAWRGFAPVSADARDLEAMADTWDAARTGRESSWWPIPPSW